MHCDKKCLANIGGHCATEVCRGPILAMDVKVADEAAAAELYRISAEMFRETFVSEPDEGR